MHRLRTGLIVTAAVLVALGIPVVALCTAPMLYAGLVENTVRRVTDLDVRFDALEVDLFPPRLASTNLVIRNPETAFDKPVAEIDRLPLTADVGRLTRRGRPALRDPDGSLGRPEVPARPGSTRARQRCRRAGSVHDPA
jgi:hypothetical protein